MLADLLGCGVRTVINLQEEDERGAGGKPFRDYRRELFALAGELALDVEFHRYPIADCDVPTFELMERIQRTIGDAVEAGKVVYVHCWGGHGRTGTVAGCWLVERGVTAAEAFRAIEQLRAHDPHLSKEPAPQTAAQRRFVEMWKRCGSRLESGSRHPLPKLQTVRPRPSMYRSIRRTPASATG
jgi:hypothetical protein